MSENTENTELAMVAQELAAIEDAIAQGVDGDNNPDVAMRRLALLGAEQHLQGNAEQAITKFEQALTLTRGLYGDKDPEVATLLYDIGSSWYRLGEHEKAIEHYEQALSIDRECGERCPAVARDLNNIGLVLDAIGEPEKAIEYYEQATAIGGAAYSRYL